MVSISQDFRSRRKRQIDAARARGKRRGREAWREDGTLRTRMATRDLDSETVRFRALEDARGQFVGAFSFPAAGGLPAERWECYRSTAGRSDQVDLFVDGVFSRTLGRKRLGLLVATRLG